MFGLLEFKYWNLFVIWILVLGISGSAVAWVPGEPIVPCGGGNNGVCDFSAGAGGGIGECFGGPNAGNDCNNDTNCQGSKPACTKCYLLKLLKNIIDFIMIAASPILASVFFVIAGVFMMLGGANPGMLSKGKSMFKNTFIGLLIVMLAWLITNTLIRTIVSANIPLEKLGNFNSQKWYELTCTTLGW